MPPAFRASPDALNKLYVKSGDVTLSNSANTSANPNTGTRSALSVASNPASMVPLSAVASSSIQTGPLVVTHEGELPADTISFNLTPGTSLSEALPAVLQAEKSIGLPTSIQTRFTGSVAQYQESEGSELWLILAAVVVIYIVLGVLYESYIHPITILSTLPSAGVGALLALLLTGEELSIVSLVGIVLLIGIVKKNAIMMIDFALDAERHEGLSPEDSIFQACVLRGALPLALSSGTGSELRQPLGIAIVGGLLLSQLLTLYTTPVIYLYMDRLAQRFSRRQQVSAVSDPAGTS